MKNLMYAFSICLLILSCSKNDTGLDSETFSPCGKHTSGQQLYRGSKGGCYYLNSNGNKTYVDRSECKC